MAPLEMTIEATDGCSAISSISGSSLSTSASISTTATAANTGHVRSPFRTRKTQASINRDARRLLGNDGGVPLQRHRPIRFYDDEAVSTGRKTRGITSEEGIVSPKHRPAVFSEEEVKISPFIRDKTIGNSSTHSKDTDADSLTLGSKASSWMSRSIEHTMDTSSREPKRAETEKWATGSHSKAHRSIGSLSTGNCSARNSSAENCPAGNNLSGGYSEGNQTAANQTLAAKNIEKSCGDISSSGGLASEARIMGSHTSGKSVYSRELLVQSSKHRNEKLHLLIKIARELEKRGKEHVSLEDPVSAYTNNDSCGGGHTGHFHGESTSVSVGTPSGTAPAGITSIGSGKLFQGEGGNGKLYYQIHVVANLQKKGKEALPSRDPASGAPSSGGSYPSELILLDEKSGKEDSRDPCPVEPSPDDPGPGIPGPGDPCQGIPAPEDPCQGIPAPEDPCQGIPAPEGPNSRDPSPKDRSPGDGAPGYLTLGHQRCGSNDVVQNVIHTEEKTMIPGTQSVGSSNILDDRREDNKLLLNESFSTYSSTSTARDMTTSGGMEERDDIESVSTGTSFTSFWSGSDQDTEDEEERETVGSEGNSVQGKSKDSWRDKMNDYTSSPKETPEGNDFDLNRSSTFMEGDQAISQRNGLCMQPPPNGESHVLYLPQEAYRTLSRTIWPIKEDCDVGSDIDDSEGGSENLQGSERDNLSFDKSKNKSSWKPSDAQNNNLSCASDWEEKHDISPSKNGRDYGSLGRVQGEHNTDVRSKVGVQIGPDEGKEVLMTISSRQKEEESRDSNISCRGDEVEFIGEEQETTVLKSMDNKDLMIGAVNNEGGHLEEAKGSTVSSTAPIAPTVSVKEANIPDHKGNPIQNITEELHAENRRKPNPINTNEPVHGPLSDGSGQEETDPTNTEQFEDGGHDQENSESPQNGPGLSNLEGDHTSPDQACIISVALEKNPVAEDDRPGVEKHKTIVGSEDMAENVGCSSGYDVMSGSLEATPASFRSDDKGGLSSVSSRALTENIVPFVAKEVSSLPASDTSRASSVPKKDTSVVSKASASTRSHSAASKASSGSKTFSTASRTPDASKGSRGSRRHPMTLRQGLRGKKSSKAAPAALATSKKPGSTKGDQRGEIKQRRTKVFWSKKIMLMAGLKSTIRSLDRHLERRNERSEGNHASWNCKGGARAVGIPNGSLSGSGKDTRWVDKKRKNEQKGNAARVQPLLVDLIGLLMTDSSIEAFLKTQLESNEKEISMVS